MSVWKAFSSGVVVIDDRYLPTLVTTFFGEVTLEAATWHGTTHQAIIEAQGRRGLHIVTITDSSYTKPPAAEVRKYWADLTRNFPPSVTETTLVAMVVIKSPVIRGVMTALRWLNPELRAVELYDSVDVALNAARQRLRTAGQQLPAEVVHYELPPESRSVTAKWLT